MSAQPPTHDVQTTSAARQSREQEPDEDAMLLAFFDRIATALSSGDATTLASCWRTPALVVGDGGVHAVSSNAEVEALFASAREQYTSRGIRATRAEIARVHWVGLHTAIAEVRWPLLDAQQRELGEERSTYILRTGDDGALEIRTAVIHSSPVNALH